MQLSSEAEKYIARLEKENSKLKNNIITFEKQFSRLEERNIKLEKRNQILEEKLRLALFRQFSRHAERFTGSGQPLLFESEERAAPEGEHESRGTVKVKEHERTKRGRKPIADTIPREDITIDISEEEKQCACGEKLVCIGEDVTERLCIIPRQVYVLRYHILKYACHSCEGSGDEDRKAVRSGTAPAAIMPGSIATPELLSFIFTEKYCNYVPFYRQEQAFSRIGVELSRQNMDNWQIKSCEKIRPIIQLLESHIKKGNVVQMDETVMHVLNEPDRDNKKESRMWLVRGGPPDKKAVLYKYHETRSSDHIVDALTGYSGYLQADGYGAYYTALNSLPGVKLVGCFAHARRYFYEAAKLSGAGSDAEAALSQIQGLYTVERKLREQLKDKQNNEINTQKEFLNARKEKCLPILNAFHDWLLERQGKILDSSKLGQAVEYTLNHWPELVRYLEDAELTPDNNAAERAIRPFVMGRKNWVMSGSPAGAQSSCELYSLIETAKENKLNPYEYLRAVFIYAAGMKPSDDWSRLLPWNINLSFSQGGGN